MITIRLILITAVALAFAVLPASAQTGKGSDETREQTAKQRKRDAEAYKSTLERLPDAADKYDPWAIARPPAETKPAKSK